MGRLIIYFLSLTAVIMLLLGSIVLADAQEATKQETHGSQSPAIKANGDVTVIYQLLSKAERELFFKQLGNQQQLIDRLLKENKAQEKDLENRNDEIRKWVIKYDELKMKISKLSENTEQSKTAKAEATAALIAGDLKRAGAAITVGEGPRITVGAGARITIN